MLRLKSCLLAALLLAVLPRAFAAPVPKAPEIAARSYVLQDFATGRVLAAQGGNERVEPASLTKMLTVYIAFDALQADELELGQMVRVSKNAQQAPGSRMFIEAGTEVSVEDLLRGIIVQSGNDASVALAEFMAGSEETFAELMNQHASALGMKDSHFVNATGLPHPDHYTTAADMVRLATATIREFPDYYTWYKEREFTYKPPRSPHPITQQIRNRLLAWDESVDGLKTGHTESAGFCLVSSAQREGMRLVAAVMGSPSYNVRFEESQKLLNYGFRFYETRRLFRGGEPRTTIRVYGGEPQEVEIGLAQDFYVTLPRGGFDGLEAIVQTPERPLAPLAVNQPVGHLEVRQGGETVAASPLVPLEPVARGGLVRRAIDRVLMMLPW